MSDRQHDAAYEAMHAAFHVAEQVGMLLDRHYGDNGTDPDMIDAWRDTLEALAAEIKREIGEPRMKLPGGGLVPRPRT
jgi:hypothetical protein